LKTTLVRTWQTLFRIFLLIGELKPEDLVGTTTDNGLNFIAAFNLLDWPRISCFGHNLDLAINKVLKIHRID